MGFNKTIIDENRRYWTWRAPGYSEVNKQELTSAQKNRWKKLMCSEINMHFPGRYNRDIHILDVGTGPGFFAIILTELGYQVTAIDLTKAMIEEARKNAGTVAKTINFLEMNAEELSFGDSCFDVVVSRNLTWNLPHPEKAYTEWIRVLKPGGLLLNFDANWYTYLFDDQARQAYEQDRMRSAEAGIGDVNIGDHFDVMEEIARRVPLSNIKRPEWDIQILDGLGIQTKSDTEVWQKVWSDNEKINLASTPMFLVAGIKTFVQRRGPA